LHARYSQEIAAFALVTSKTLVNRRSNKVVNIASTKMMKKIFVSPFSLRHFAGLFLTEILPAPKYRVEQQKARGNLSPRAANCAR
jgi:hypothetical protein